MNSAPAWVDALREAASSSRAGRAESGIEVVRGARPGWLASDAIDALTSSLIAALIIAAALLRTRMDQGAFDLIALLLRTASFAFALRAIIASVRFALRVFGRDATAEAHALAWSEHGLYYRAPGEERWIARADLVGFVVPDERRVRGSATSLTPLLVVARPTTKPEYWELPPYFAPRPEILLARLERGSPPRAHAPDTLAPPQLSPEARYLRVANGKVEPGEVPVPEGFGYRLRAPYGVLLALVFVADAVGRAGPLRTRIWPAALLAAGLALAAVYGWFWWMRARRAVRLGMALLLTPEELLVRGKHGAVSVPWTQLASAEVLSTLAWSPLIGSYLIRVLWFSALDGSRMPFDGAFLGVPPEVVAKLAEAYRSGALSGAPASTSQGSGGGGGISATAGTTTTPSNATSPSDASESRSAAAADERSNES